MTMLHPALRPLPAPIPFNRPALFGREMQYIAQAILEGHAAGDGAFTKRCQRCSSRASALKRHCSPPPARTPWRWRPAARHRARRRGHRPVVHVRLDGERLRPARRDDRLRRHPPGHAQPRRRAPRRALITPRTKAIVPVHYAGVACEMDAILAIADAARHAGGRGQRARPVRQLPRPAARHLRLPGDAELSRDQELQLRRGRRAAHQRRRASSSAPRSSARRAPTAAGSSAARWTSTPGSTSARATCRPTCWRRFLFAQLEARRRDPGRAAARSGSATRRRSGRLGRREWRAAAARSRRTASSRITCSTCCCRRSKTRQALDRASARARHPRRLPLSAAAPFGDRRRATALPGNAR